MSRLVFQKGEQTRFLNQVKDILGLNSDAMGKFIGISGRSFRDWQSERTLGHRESLQKLSELSNIPLPNIIEIREENWSGRINGTKGGLIRVIKHGPPGTQSGRKKGGIKSQALRRIKPHLYQHCSLPNTFDFPNQLNKQLAELVGIILGDGCITSKQIQITLNSVADADYSKYISQLITSLFSRKPSIYHRKDSQASVIIITGASIVSFFKQHGLIVGNKIKNQAQVPLWIKTNTEFSKWCTRGLVDTDGGIFEHRYSINNKKYKYLKLQYSSKSRHFRQFVLTTLRQQGFNPKSSGNKQVWLYSEAETIKYLSTIGSSNYRLTQKIR